MTGLTKKVGFGIYFLAATYVLLGSLNALALVGEDADGLFSQSALFVLMFGLGLFACILLILRKPVAKLVFFVFASLFSFSALIVWAHKVDSEGFPIGRSIILLIATLGVIYLLGWWGYFRSKKILGSQKSADSEVVREL